MTTLQPNRPIRNGVRPSAFNYALAGVGVAAGCAWTGLRFTVMFIAVAALMLVAQPLIYLVALAVWCWNTCRQARAIVATPVGEPIPAQHGLSCLARILVRVTLLRAMLGRDDGWWTSPCPAGCTEGSDCF